MKSVCLLHILRATTDPAPRPPLHVCFSVLQGLLLVVSFALVSLHPASSQVWGSVEVWEKCGG
jgi:hypothetical protein